MIFDDVLEFDILPNVEKPARYAGGDLHQIVKDWDSIRQRFCIVFPDVYEIGMSNNGILILYDLINGREHSLCERAFAVWPDMEAALRRHGKPAFSLENRRPLGDFDLLGFSFGYEMAYTNTLTLLDLSGIPFYAKDRGPEHPLVIAGGCCTFNSEPIADFLDLALIGEGEEAVHEILDVHDRMLQERWGGDRSRIDRKEMLRELARIQGVYVPGFYEVSYNGLLIDGIRSADPAAPDRVTKREIWDMATARFPERPVFSNMRVIHDRAAVEVFRGCTEGCRYCQAGMIYRPRRERPAEQTAGLARALQANLGCDEIALQSLNTIDYTGLEPVLKELTESFGERRVALSIPSTRLDSFTESIGERLRVVRDTGLTFAPEAGSQRLRDAINRPMTEETMFESIRKSFALGFRKIKLYFVIGFPTETDEDVRAIPRLVEGMQRLVRECKGKAASKIDFHVSVSNLVPKCFTPFQWMGQEPLEGLQRKQNLLRDAFRSNRRVKLSLHNRYLSFWEAVFSRGDRRLSRVLVEGWMLGARFDAWNDFFSHEKWLQAFDNLGMDPRDFANRDFLFGEVLPWARIDAGVTEKFLWREWNKTFKGAYTEDCHDGRCSACGLPCLTLDSAKELAPEPV